MAKNYEQVQQLYIAIYGRPADVPGRDYWGRHLADDPGAIPTIAQTFSQLPEFATEFGGKTSGEIVSIIYDNLFGSAPNSMQLNIWGDQLSTPGGFGAVVNDMIIGANTVNANVLQNKVNVAVAFTASLDTSVETSAYSIEAGRNTAKQFIDYVDDVNSVAVTTTPFALALVTSEMVAGANWSAPVRVAQQVQDLYVSYFGRAADPAGFDYWSSLLDGDTANPRLELISSAFATSAEHSAEYPQASVAEKIDALYQNLFGRGSDLDGRNFWIGAIESGDITIDNAVTAVAGGAQASDRYVFRAKVDVAQAVTAAIDSPAEIQAYGNQSALDAVSTYIAQIYDEASFNAAINLTAINNLVSGFTGQANAFKEGDESIRLIGIVGDAESPISF